MSPRALVLYSVVLAAFLAVTTAFVGLDKTVTLTVDGKTRQVRSFSRTVAGVLARAGVKVGAHDTVAPDASADVTDGSRIVVRHGRQLALTIDGHRRVVWVTAATVDEALQQLGIRADGAFLSASRSQRIPLSGFDISLRLQHTLSILHDGKVSNVSTNVATVGEALQSAGITLARLDAVSVPLDTRPTDGMTVRVVRVRLPRETHTDRTPYPTIRVADASLYKGTTRKIRGGVRGVRVRVYQLKVLDGRIVYRHLLSSKMVVPPAPAIYHYGTKPRPAPKPAPSYSGNAGGSVDSLNWYALAGCESGHDPQAVSNGTYYGLYQFTIGTWESVGGSGKPTDASSSEQTYRAKLLYKRDGDSPWPTCGHYLYS